MSARHEFSATQSWIRVPLIAFLRAIIGEELGIDIETGLRLLVGTVTGKFVAYLHEVNLSVASFEFSSLVAFAANEEFQRNVLGRRGFIEQMSIGLIDYEGKLYLGRYVG